MTVHEFGASRALLCRIAGTSSANYGASLLNSELPYEADQGITTDQILDSLGVPILNNESRAIAIENIYRQANEEPIRLKHRGNIPE